MNEIEVIQKDLKINADALDLLYTMRKRHQINEEEFDSQDKFLNEQRQTLKDELLTTMNK